jgi:hypothetical protein
MDREKRAKIIITVVIVTCLVVPLAYVIYDYQGLFINGETPPETPPLPTIVFTMDKNNRTLTVKTIEPTAVNWASLKIGPGNATLPSGIIKQGDVITNCSGHLILFYHATNYKFGEWDFS